MHLTSLLMFKKSIFIEICEIRQGGILINPHFNVMICLLTDPQVVLLINGSSNLKFGPSHFSSPFFFFPFIFISWRLITLQYCSGFCHTLTWISHGVTCIPHPDPPSHLPLHRFLWVFPVHQAQALVSRIQPGLVVQSFLTLCFMPSDAESQLTGKDPDAGKDWGQEKGPTGYEMVG